MATLTLNFTPPSTTPSEGYVVKYRKVGDPGYITMSPNPTTSPIVITDLDAGQYEGTVQTSCSPSLFSSELSFLSNTFDCSTGIDMVFILDITGSMGTAITNLKSAIDAYTDKVIEKSDNNYRLALITVSEPSGGPADIAHPVDFSLNNKTSLIAGLDPLVADGGGGVPEPTDVALGYVLEDSNNYVGLFRTDVVKIVVLITDALPSGGNDAYGPEDLTRVQELADLAFSQDVRIFAVNVGGGTSNTDVQNIMQIYADTSLGVYSESPSGEISTNIIDALDALCNN